MKNLKLTLALAALVAFVGSAQAVQITGGISLAGGYTVNTGDLNTATAFSSFNNNIVTSAAGSFGFLVPGAPVTMNPFTFNPFAGPVTPLWSFTSGANVGSFDLTSITFRDQPGDNTLELKGSGILHLTGFDATGGSWVFTANQAGGTFSWSSSDAAYVPDGGTTAMLLGSALAGLAFLRRKLA